MTTFPNHLQVRPSKCPTFDGEPAIGLTLRDVEHIFGATEARDIADRMLAAATKVSGERPTPGVGVDLEYLRTAADLMREGHPVYCPDTLDAARARLVALEQPGVTEAFLRTLIDVTWGHAYESEQVPSTSTQTMLIARARERAALAPAPITQAADGSKLDDVTSNIHEAGLALASLPAAFKQEAARRIVQVSVCDKFTAVLCDDGSLWWMDDLRGWKRFGDIPQPAALPPPEMPDTANTSLGGQRVEAPASIGAKASPVDAHGLVEAACRQAFDMWALLTDDYREDKRHEMKVAIRALRDIGALIPWAARVIQNPASGAA